MTCTHIYYTNIFPVSFICSYFVSYFFQYFVSLFFFILFFSLFFVPWAFSVKFYITDWIQLLFSGSSETAFQIFIWKYSLYHQSASQELVYPTRRFDL